jgi:hypothetical protein
VPCVVRIIAMQTLVAKYNVKLSIAEALIASIAFGRRRATRPSPPPSCARSS